MKEDIPTYSEEYSNEAHSATREDNVITYNCDGNQQEGNETERLWAEGCRALEQATLHLNESEELSDLKSITDRDQFESLASTRKGGRNENQDTAAFRITDKGLLLVVCDGMGGGPAGKRASYLAAHTITTYIAEYAGDQTIENLLAEAIIMAHKVVVYDTKRNPKNSGMGTTAAVMLINDEKAVCAHVGDSRIYQYRDRKLIFRTTDHSLVARKMLIEGWTDEEARTSNESNIITQAIGHGEISPEIDVRPYCKGDRFLICSDGIWGHYPQNDLTKIMTSAPNIGGSLSDLMVTTDNIGIAEGGHHDNFTAIVLITNIDSKLKDKMAKRAKLLIIILGVLLSLSLIANIILITRNSRSDSSDSEEEIYNVENNITLPSSENQKTSAESNTSGEETGDFQQSRTSQPSSDIQSVQPISNVKGDTIYVVEQGDVINKIAVRFNTTPEKIKQANPNIDINKIGIGQKLIIPRNK